MMRTNMVRKHLGILKVMCLNAMVTDNIHGKGVQVDGAPSKAI